MPSSIDLHTWVTEQATARPILADRYFTALDDGEMSRAHFIQTQTQFFFAVRYFSRPMAALMARMPSSALRQGLIHNLAEEHGADDAKPGLLDPTLAHDQTFTRFLASLGVTLDGTLHEGPAVRAFNNALMGVCLMEPVALAFGCLGVIEHTFAGISARIASVVVQRGWIPEGELVHYNLHAEIDERHAADFFKVVAKDWQTSDAARAEIMDGVHTGLHVFGRLYQDLWDEASRRS